ncbi:MAG: hypothetical protein HYX92_22725 [Chloroflexi bacterium]|nr:hypothetical protein [Chloroflexota bacterium]
MDQLKRASSYFLKFDNVASYVWSGLLMVLFGELPDTIQYFDGYLSTNETDKNPEVDPFWYGALVVVGVLILLSLWFRMRRSAILTPSDKRWQPLLVILMTAVVYGFVFALAMLIFEKDALDLARERGSIAKLLILPVLLGAIPVVIKVSDKMIEETRKTASKLEEFLKKVKEVFGPLRELNPQMVSDRSVESILTSIEALRDWLRWRYNTDVVQMFDPGQQLSLIANELSKLDLLLRADKPSQLDVFLWVAGDTSASPGTLKLAAETLRSLRTDSGVLAQFISSVERKWPSLKEEGI